MPSLIPGYEYDIFISYRQKDNKYDGWVTEFVSNLRKELEATFKEDISIYFDENPHDGLHETHDVNKSLEKKLRCLIFIPILSQTYCDPKSFAWKNEFLAFRQRASSDKLGLDVNLLNGNVAKRILPVKIHELDSADRQTLEKEIGPVRSIDFIFRQTGVNRPLRANEARENENLNKTYYRDQINKVANAVKGIIVSVQSGSTKEGVIEGKKEKYGPRPNHATIFYFGMAALMGLVALFVWLVPFGPSNERNASIAILPFRNNTGATELDYYGVGMASEIRTQLSVSKQFNFVSSLQATLPYRDTNKSTQDIGEELNVEFIITGLYQKSGDRMKVEAELVQANTGQVLWTVSFERTLKDVFEIQSEIARKVIDQLAEDNSQPPELNLTSNIDAYAHYTRGKQLLDNTYGDSSNVQDSYAAVLQQFEKAIQFDSTFIDAWAELISVESFVLMALEKKDAAREAKIRKYYSLVDERFPDSWQKELAEAQIAYRIDFDYKKALQLFENVLVDNPDNVHAVYALSSIYKREFDFKKALVYGSKLINLNPAHGGNWVNIGQIFEFMGDNENAFKAYLKGWQLSKSKNFAEGMTYQAVIAGISPDSLSDELKKADKGFTFWNYAAKRQWKHLKAESRAKANYEELAIACLALEQRDSALFFANKMKLKNISDSLMYFVLTSQWNAVEEIDKRFDAQGKVMKDDRMVAAMDIATDVDLFVWGGDYKKATDKLKQLNKDYPEFRNYKRFSNNPLYDGIKKDYPEFGKALRSITMRPVPNMTDYVKL
jgi:TolB-like protein